MDQAAGLGKLMGRIQALRAKTVGNGCTEDEAFAAAAKVAELLDRHGLDPTDVDRVGRRCERVVFATAARKRMPLADCIDAIARFCDCRVWREKDAGARPQYVFFGLPADAAAAHFLAGVVDETLRAALGRYKTGSEYRRVRHRDRHLANASFALGMATSVGERLDAMKAARLRTGAGTGRDLQLAKAGIVDAELGALGLAFTTSRAPGRIVSPDAFEAGDAAGASFAPPTRPATRDDVSGVAA